MISLGISSSVRPTASFAAIFAIGNPVAFEARAELLDTLGFISITIILPSAGFNANWILDPPVSTPISRMISIDASRMIWYSLSVSVCAGATVIESPVCMPIGSKFSIEHIMTTLSLLSRITSSSYSFHPRTDSSISTWLVGLSLMAFLRFSVYSFILYAMLPPVPPMVKEGLRISGKLCSSRHFIPSSNEPTWVLLGVLNPSLSIAALKSSLSSAFLMAGSLAPMSSTLCLSRMPLSESSIARFNAVCPPIVGSRASGRSFSIIISRNSSVSGSM